MCIHSAAGRMRQDFQETASKPQNLHIYIKKKPQPNKKPSTIFFFSFFFEHEGDWRPDGLLRSSPCWGGCFPRDRMGPGRRAVKVCWAAEGKKMQLGRSNFTLCCQSERCCRSRAASRQPLTEDGWYEHPRQPPALGFAQRFLFLGTGPGQPHHCALKNVLAGVKSNSFVLTGSGRDASKCWQTPTWCISHRGSGQGKVMLGANPSGCSHSPIQAGAALSPGCDAVSHFLRDFPPGLCCSCKARIYSLLGSGASPPAPGLLFHRASVPSLGCRVPHMHPSLPANPRQKAASLLPQACGYWWPRFSCCTSPLPGASSSGTASRTIAGHLPGGKM